MDKSDSLDNPITVIYYGEEQLRIYSIFKLQKLYNEHCPSGEAKIEWLQFFQSLAEGSGVHLTKEDEVKVDLQYLKDLCEILSETPEHAIVNYIQYNFLYNNDMTYFRKAIKDSTYNERNIYCIQRLKVTEEVTKEVIESHISPKAKKIVSDMFDDIKSVLKTEIRNSWLVHGVKKEVLDRALNMKYKYGIPGDPLKQKLAKKLATMFEVSPVALQNELNFKRARIVDIIQTYKKNEEHRGKRSSEANACYSYKENELILGIAFIFPPYFHQDAPIGFNYGRLGYTIGHEISHAFDFDKMKEVIDCSAPEHKEQMKTMLKTKRKCFMNQFNRFGTDGLRTLYENVADTQGLKLAWKAMNTVIAEKETRDERLPNFKQWNQEKLFFLSFANLWCSNPEYREDNIEDVHAPHVIRSLGTIKNMNEFAKTYGCTNESMNPITKCDWWMKSSKHRIKPAQ